MGYKRIPVTIVKHPDFKEREKQLITINDACSPTGVKDAGRKYLPNPGDANNQTDIEKYNNYHNRAMYYGFSGQTVRAMAGLAFMKGVTVADVSTGLEYINTDIDGDRLGISQSMKASFTSTYRDGRAGLLVDFPPTDGTMTRAQQEAAGAKSIIRRYDALQIANWHTTKVGANDVLSLVSLFEVCDELMEDGITIQRVGVERRLILEDVVYRVEIYHDGAFVESYEPRINGQTLAYIPFFFIGAENNDSRFDDSPMYPICELNIGHYRNSADYEDSVFMLRPQPWASGLTQTWYDENLQGFRFGSGSLFPLPEGGSFGIEQPSPNDQAYEAMQYKQKSMVALGAKHLTGELSYNTATEAMIGEAGSNSVVQTVMDNVEQAYNDALMVVAEFMGESIAPVVVINTDLSNVVSDANTAQLMVTAWMGGLIGKEDARAYFRKTGLVDRTDEEIDEDIALNLIGGDNTDNTNP
jgi:hypothetical protein